MLGTTDLPASTLVGVAALAQPGYLIEVEAVAVICRGGRSLVRQTSCCSQRTRTHSFQSSPPRNTDGLAPPTHGDCSCAEAARRWENIIDQVADLFLRVGTHEAELAATVHFATRELAQAKGEQPREIDVLDEVMRWKHRRRPPLTEAEVAMAIRHLSGLGKLDVRPSPELPVSDEALIGLGA